MPLDKRIKLAKLYFHMSITAGMPTQIIATCADGFKALTKSKHKVTIEDMRLPWKPIYDILNQDLFLTRRQFEYSLVVFRLGTFLMANYVYIIVNYHGVWDTLQRIHAGFSILPQSMKCFLHFSLKLMARSWMCVLCPLFKADIRLISIPFIQTILSSHYYITTFLPLSHPQYYFPMLFRLWESINSYLYDERMLQFISQLTEMHTDAEISNPRRIEMIPDDEISDGEGRPRWDSETKNQGPWHGLYKDVGIFTEHEWNFLMCKCLASMGEQIGPFDLTNTSNLSIWRQKFLLQMLDL